MARQTRGRLSPWCSRGYCRRCASQSSHRNSKLLSQLSPSSNKRNNSNNLQRAIHIKATRTFVDEFGKTRKNGDEWLVTNKETETYIPGVYEEIKGNIDITVLNNRQYCIILNPLDDTTGKVLHGQKKLVKVNLQKAQILIFHNYKIKLC